MNNETVSSIAYELFGEMRYLTPEENKKKAEMYRKMSEKIEIETEWESSNELNN